MMRLRSAALVVAFSVLISATAYAECAWVLWTGPLKGSQRAWEPYQAFQGDDDCDRARVSMGEFNRRHPDGVVEAFCLPDTVDPRGVKGK